MSLPPPPQTPMPVEPLGYYVPGTPRPGILVAVGIISIVVGLLGMLFGCSGLGQALVYGTTTTMVVPAPATLPATMPMPGAPVVAASPAPPAPALVPLARMTNAEQQVVITALIGRMGLSPKRIEMLQLLLSQCADDIVPFAGANITPQNMATTITGAGVIPASDGSTIAFYTLVNGRIEVGDDDAVFNPVGGGTSVRVNRSQSSVSVTTSSGNATAAWAVAGPATFAPPSGRLLGMIIFAMATSALNLLLAILLVVAGILVLTGRRSGRKLHLIYAWTRIPLAILGAIASNLLLHRYIGRMGLTLGAATSLMTLQAVVYAIIACIYPVALIIVMNTKTVREHYRHMTVR